ncbi:unnamed protein product [Sphagnum jensenii]|uniref:RING-type domain-containing protein n=2 Tax=Sphagnum jensenii TaxID=128206 RepID=A0ABP1A0Q4_9BRYO
MATDDDEEFFGLFDDAEDFDISAAAVAAAATVGVPDTTSAIQEMMNSSEDLFVLRISQTHDFKTNLKDSEDAKWKEIEQLMEDSVASEFEKLESYPVEGVPLLEACQARQGDLIALKNQIAQEECLNLLESQINSATDDEGQIVEEIVNRSLYAVEQQMKLKELDEKHQNSIFALREDQHKTLLEHLKCNREERDKLLDECSDSRMLLLEQVEATKANTQTVLNDAFTMLEQNHEGRQEQHMSMSNIAAMLMHLGVVDQHSTSPEVFDQSSTTPGTVPDCSVCFEELDSGSGNTNGKKRACFRPCNHATVCLDCAARIWRETKTCPICKATLTTVPEVIHL